VRRGLAIGALLLALGGCATTPATTGQGAAACRAPLKAMTQVDLYFGRNIPTGGEVSDAQWRQFLDEVVTPRFPDGLSVLDVHG
jgi:starvation-inducible outer membrane lipoprotein